jgi:hypothetical protein
MHASEVHPLTHLLCLSLVFLSYTGLILLLLFILSILQLQINFIVFCYFFLFFLKIKLLLQLSANVKYVFSVINFVRMFFLARLIFEVWIRPWLNGSFFHASPYALLRAINIQQLLVRILQVSRLPICTIEGC